jgi:putative tricarboxylic transport membrane protein
MHAIQMVIDGFSVAFTPTNVFYLFIGTFLGSLVGVLPGIGPSAGMILLIPLTFSMDPATAIIMIAGIYYGSLFGGSTTSILLNLPGESSSVMTAIEGYPLTQQGRGGVALGMSAVSSFVAGTLAVVGLMFMAVPLSRLALSLGPSEECVLVFAILTLVAGLSGSSVVKGLSIAALGLVLATIGLEPLSAQTRLHFDIPALQPGISFVAAGVGLLGLPEVIETIQKPVLASIQKGAVKLRDVFPTKQDYKDSLTAFPTGFIVGFICGVLPGMGGNIGQFITHAAQKAISRKPQLFGKGSIEAVTALEGQNNASSIGSMVPMLSIGIPSTGASAVLMGAMIIHGLQPGPLLFQMRPEVAWGLIASMYLGNVMLLILNWPLIGIWISIMRIPQHIIMIGVLALSVAGVYAVDNSMANVYIMFAFGVLGYFMRKFGFPVAPIILTLLLATMLETSLHRSLLISGGSWGIFVSTPFSATLVGIAALSILLQIPWVSRPLWSLFRRRFGQSAAAQNRNAIRDVE